MLATCSATSMAAPHAMYRVGLDTDSPPRSPLRVRFYSEGSFGLLRSKSHASRLKRAVLTANAGGGGVGGGGTGGTMTITITGATLPESCPASPAARLGSTESARCSAHSADHTSCSAPLA